MSLNWRLICLDPKRWQENEYKKSIHPLTDFLTLRHTTISVSTLLFRMCRKKTDWGARIPQYNSIPWAWNWQEFVPSFLDDVTLYLFPSPPEGLGHQAEQRRNQNKIFVLLAPHPIKGGGINKKSAASISQPFLFALAATRDKSSKGRSGCKSLYYIRDIGALGVIATSIGRC